MTGECRCHPVDMKNAAFVKMRDSVSFYKQILIEYVLRNHSCLHAGLYRFSDGLCAHPRLLPMDHVLLRTHAARISLKYLIPSPLPLPCLLPVGSETSKIFASNDNPVGVPYGLSAAGSTELHCAASSSIGTTLACSVCLNYLWDYCVASYVHLPLVHKQTVMR